MPASIRSSFLEMWGRSPPAATRSRETHVAHRRIKIERVYRPYLTAAEAECILPVPFTHTGQLMVVLYDIWYVRMLSLAFGIILRKH
jgi:hypothetical protein